MRRFARLIFVLCLALPIGSVDAQAVIRSTPLINFPDGVNYMLFRDLTYDIGTRTGLRIVVPRGFVTDFASVPRALHSVIGPTGRYTNAAIVHDYLYWIQTCSRGQSDNLMAIAMREAGVSALQEWNIYNAVRLGGQSAWDNNRNERSSGLIRTLAAPNDTVPAFLTWPQYRQALRSRQVAGAPEPAIDPRVCTVGNDIVVPVGPR